jgi:hypothetical protein
MNKKTCDRELTKLKIFGAIYDLHIEDYRKNWKDIKETEENSRNHEMIYYPIDLYKVADVIKATPDIINQILYYYDDIYTKNNKYFYNKTQGKWKINFPLLCVKLAELQEKFDYEESLRRSAKISSSASLIAIVVSTFALIVSIIMSIKNAA